MHKQRSLRKLCPWPSLLIELAMDLDPNGLHREAASPWENAFPAQFHKHSLGIVQASCRCNHLPGSPGYMSLQSIAGYDHLPPGQLLPQAPGDSLSRPSICLDVFRRDSPSRACALHRLKNAMPPVPQGRVSYSTFERLSSIGINPCAARKLNRAHVWRRFLV